MQYKSITGRDPRSGKSLKVLLDNGRIQAIDSGPANEQAWLSPGFIDLQVNGYFGSDINSSTVDPDVVVSLTRKMLATGVTTFLPTIVTAPEARIAAALRAIAEARRSSPLVDHAISFVHVEGPHISPEDGPRGAHAREHIRPPSLDEFKRWQTSGDLVGMVTLSPHWNNALEYISTLAAQGIVVAIGHSDAAPARIHEAADAGATLSTHLGNGLGSPLPRHPNLLWAQLAEDRLAACFIADGHHLPADTLKAMLRAKGIDRGILVSDTVALGGMPAGIYDAGAVGGRVEVTPDGRIVSASGGHFLAGAYRPLADGVANVAGMGGFSLGDAIQMVTENPGRFVGGRGSLRVGADADLVRFDWNPETAKLKIQTVLVKGEEYL